MRLSRRDIRIAGALIVVAGLAASGLAILAEELGVGADAARGTFGWKRITLLVVGGVGVAVGALLLARPQIASPRRWAGPESSRAFDQSPREPRSAAKTLLTVIAAAVFLLCSGQALIGATQVGISTDEPTHLDRMNMWFNTGWYVPARFFDGDDQPEPTVEAGRRHSYGAGYSIFGHTAAVLVGAEEWGTTSGSADAYVARRVALALLGIAAALAVGYGVAAMTGSRLAGLWAAAATMALPLWAGYSMFAVKDIPAAAGWTFVTAGLVVALHRSPGLQSRVAIGLLCAAGVWFSVGVRTALWVPLAVGVVVFGILAAARWRQVAGNAVAAAVGLTVGMAAVAGVHHRNAATPVEWLVSSVRTSGDFPWTGGTLTAGELITEKPPWWYLPAWIGGAMPVLVGLLAVAGIVAAAVVLTRGGPDGPMRGRLASNDASVTLWGLQALLLPAVATVGGATMYAGLRQHLYVLPALAALAGYAAARFLWAWRGTWIVPALLTIALVVPTAEQLRLFPYQFVYKNAIAGPVNDRWESDMHWVSGREALSRVPGDVDAYCYSAPTRLVTGEIAEPSPAPCVADWRIGPFADEQGSKVTDPAPGDLVWVLGRLYRGSPPASGCIEHDNVTRPLRRENVVLSYVLLCDPDVLD